VFFSANSIFFISVYITVGLLKFVLDQSVIIFAQTNLHNVKVLDVFFYVFSAFKISFEIQCMNYRFSFQSVLILKYK